MKAIITPVFAFASLLCLASAQEIESVPQDHAIGIARKLVATLGTPADAPIATEVDVEKAVGIKGGSQAGVLAMPDKKLTAEALAAAGKEPIAVGHLWMRLVVPSVNNSAPSADKLRTVTVSGNNEDAKVELYYLTVSKSEKGELELSLIAKDKTALVKVPLVKTDAAANSTPIALAAHKEGENTGVLVVSVFGSHKADLTLTKPRE